MKDRLQELKNNYNDCDFDYKDIEWLFETIEHQRKEIKRLQELEKVYKTKWIVVENYSSMFEAIPALFEKYDKAKSYYDVMISDGTNCVFAQILDEHE